jgi:hypothetical protein
VHESAGYWEGTGIVEKGKSIILIRKGVDGNKKTQ